MRDRPKRLLQVMTVYKTPEQRSTAAPLQRAPIRRKETVDRQSGAMSRATSGRSAWDCVAPMTLEP